MKEDRVYLRHIIDAIDRIAEYTTDGRDRFFKDSKTQDAVLRNLEVIGEAVKNLSSELRAAHPEVRWRDVAGMRDRLIHGYFSVDLALVWDTVESSLPGLRGRLESILATSH